MTSAFRWQGIIEGFYGKPWSLQERKDMMQFMAQNGFNVYVYAPKLDPYHREKWAQPYPDEILDELRELVRTANTAGVKFVFAISPGLSIDYTSVADRERLISKCQSLGDLGVKAFGLFFDDIPQEPTAQLAADQAQLANSVYTALAEGSTGPCQLFFCPTKYQGDGQTSYVHAIGEHLDTAIEVFWTGPHVCSQELRSEHAEAVSKVLRRPVLFWDNYPVNDALMGAELHIGPYTGRAPDLPDFSSGIIVNPMEAAEASKIPLRTVAAYMSNPQEYEPGEAWRESFEAVSAEAAGALERFGEANLISPLHPEDPPRMQQAVADYKERAASFDFTGAMTGLGQFFDEMKRDVEVLRNLPNKALVDDIEPWLQDYQRWAECGQQTLAIMRGTFSLLLEPPADETERREMQQTLAHTRRQLGLTLKEAIDWPTKVCGDVVRRFCHDVYRGTGRYLSG